MFTYHAPTAAPSILLVEDHPVCRDALLHMIGRAGFGADAAEDGLAALQRFNRGKYALVLTDLEMPRLDGFRLAAAIRMIERTQGRLRTPIIALTASVPPGQLERCFESGMDDYVSKPMVFDAFVEKLRRWLPAAPAFRSA